MHQLAMMQVREDAIIQTRKGWQISDRKRMLFEGPYVLGSVTDFGADYARDDAFVFQQMRKIQKMKRDVNYVMTYKSLLQNIFGYRRYWNSSHTS